MRNLNFSAFVSRVLLLGCFVFSVSVHAQSTFTNVAGEYAIIGTLPGDQMMSRVAFNASGGWLIWQDNVTDNQGLGIGARHLNGTLSGDFNSFRVNQVGAGDQENPSLTMLKNGGAAFVWQGGQQGFQKIYARFMGVDNIFVGGDVQVNVYTNRDQITPVVSCLNNSNVVVAWSSWAQDGDGYGIFARLLSHTGAPVSAEFQVNESAAYNQRSPAVAALANGSFIVVWASEAVQIGSQVTTFQNDPNQYDVITANGTVVRILARIYDSSGNPVAGGEFPVSGGARFCGSPSVAATADGGFIVSWSQHSQTTTNGWDIFARAYAPTGSPLGSSFLGNTYQYGDQFGPKVSASGTNCCIIWTSLAQDTSVEGIYGQYFTLSGSKIGSEFRVNSTTVSKQMQPDLGVDGSGRYLATWSSFIGGTASFDLYAQRFSNGDLPIPSIPYVSALDQSSLSVAWPDLAGYPVAFYELYQDGGVTPIVVNALHVSITNLLASSTHTFQLRYQLTDGRRSALSAVASGTTWGADANADGVPDDWQAAQWGGTPANWPSPAVDSDGDGASNLAEFLAGTNPNDVNSVLKTRVTRIGSQLVFSWNTEAGFIYQVQVSTDLILWQNSGLARFAHSNTDTITLPENGQSSFYRVIRLR